MSPASYSLFAPYSVTKCNQAMLEPQHFGNLTLRLWRDVVRMELITTKYNPNSGAADSRSQEGQPPILAKSRRGKTISLPLHLTHYAGWRSYNWVLLNEELTDFTGFVT